MPSFCIIATGSGHPWNWSRHHRFRPGPLLHAGQVVQGAEQFPCPVLGGPIMPRKFILLWCFLHPFLSPSSLRNLMRQNWLLTAVVVAHGFLATTVVAASTFLGDRCGQCTRWPTAGGSGAVWGEWPLPGGSCSPSSTALRVSTPFGTVRGFTFAGGTVRGFLFAFVPLRGFSFAGGTVHGFHLALVRSTSSSSVASACCLTVCSRPCVASFCEGFFLCRDTVLCLSAV